jgi:hypothetical protein
VTRVETHPPHDRHPGLDPGSRCLRAARPKKRAPGSGAGVTGVETHPPPTVTPGLTRGPATLARGEEAGPRLGGRGDEGGDAPSSRPSLRARPGVPLPTRRRTEEAGPRLGGRGDEGGDAPPNDRHPGLDPGSRCLRAAGPKKRDPGSEAGVTGVPPTPATKTPAVQTRRDCLTAAAMKLANRGCGSKGFDFSSG